MIKPLDRLKKHWLENGRKIQNGKYVWKCSYQNLKRLTGNLNNMENLCGMEIGENNYRARP